MIASAHDEIDVVGRGLRQSLRSCGIVLIGAAALLIFAISIGVGAPDPHSSGIFYRLLVSGEILPIGASLVFLLGTAALLNCADAEAMAGRGSRSCMPHLESTRRLILLASLLLPVAWAFWTGGTEAFSMDEYAVRWQARSFLRGEIVGRVNRAFVVWEEFVRPVFILPARERGGWVSGYLPGYSLLLVPFEAVGATWLLNPLLNVVSLGAVWRICAERFPGDWHPRVVGVLMLALSTQFVAAAATAYSMPAHLAGNLLWLLLHLRKDRRALLAGPVGFFASILHQPVPHVLFVLPFLLRMVRERRIRQLCWYAGWYVAALFVLAAWSGLMTGRLATIGPDGVLWWPGASNVVALLFHCALLLSWNTPLAGVVLIFRAQNWRSLSPIDIDLLMGIVLSLTFYLSFQMVTQGHGWGWRYGHQLLGNVALLCAFTWPDIASAIGARVSTRLLLFSIAITLVVQFPARLSLMQQFSVPFATAHRWLRGQTAGALVVPVDSIWYGRDLIRNEPSLTSPILLNGSGPLPPALVQRLEQLPGGLRRISVSELERLGLERLPSRR